jgi:hypothetical protein
MDLGTRVRVLSGITLIGMKKMESDDLEIDNTDA